MTPEQEQEFNTMKDLVTSMRAGEDLEMNEALKRFIVGAGLSVVGTEPAASATVTVDSVPVTKEPDEIVIVEDGNGNTYKLVRFN